MTKDEAMGGEERHQCNHRKKLSLHWNRGLGQIVKAFTCCARV